MMKTINGNGWNPVLSPDVHIPDSEGHVVHDGKLYVFGSEDRYSDKYCSKQYITASTANMTDWTVHNTIFDSDRAPWQGEDQSYPGAVDWSKPSPFLQKMFKRDQESGKKIDVNHFPIDDLYAPDVIEKDGQFYLFFCSSDVSEGVAVADRPEGPYHDAVRLHVDGIDPSVFIDDDGQAYLYWGQFSAHVAKLNDDLLSIDESTIKDGILTEETHHFHEGSSVRKINGKYYYIYASISNGYPSSLDYAIGETPMGPFKYMGTIINNDHCNPGNWNNHGSIGLFNGQWYVFYHRSSQGTEYNRRLCIEPITIKLDGSIDEVKMTSQGAGRSLRTGDNISLYRACEIQGHCYLVPTADGNEKLTNITANDEVSFRYFDLNQPVSRIDVQATGSGQFDIINNNKVVGNVQISNGKIVNAKIDIEANNSVELKFRFLGTTDLQLISFKLDE